MSKLDYITIAIVAACILAIIFLVYKMTDLFNDQPVSDPIETTTTPVEEEDSTYQYDVDDAENQGGEASTDDATNSSESNTSGTQTSGDNTNDKPTDEQADVPAKNPTSVSQPSGKFMVIAGTFSKSALAKNQVSKLRKLGFSHASVKPFDRGKYDVVLVDRFDNMANAERLVKELKADGIASYIKTKEAQ